MAKKGCGPLGCRNKQIFLKHLDESSGPCTPSLTLSVDNLDFSNVAPGGSSVKTFTLQASCLPSKIESYRVGSFTNEFTYSIDNITFVNFIEFIPVNGNVPLTTIYVKFSPTGLGATNASIEFYVEDTFDEYVYLEGVGAYDVDAQAWFDSLGFLQPDDAYKLAIDTFIIQCKTDGNWNLFDRIRILATRYQQNATICLKSLTSLIEGAAPIWTQDIGYTVNDINSAIDLNFIPSSDGVNFTLDDASFGSYNQTDSQNNGYDMGCAGNGGGNGADNIASRTLSDLFIGRINSNALLTDSVANADSSGLISITRPDVNTIVFYAKGVNIGSAARVSSNLPNVSMTLGCRNVNGVFSIFTGRTYGGAFIGSAGIDQLKLKNALDTFYASI